MALWKISAAKLLASGAVGKICKDVAPCSPRARKKSTSGCPLVGGAGEGQRRLVGLGGMDADSLGKKIKSVSSIDRISYDYRKIFL